MNARALKILHTRKLLPLLVLLVLPAVTRAQYFYTNSYGIWSYTPNTGPVTITGLTNIPVNGVVVISDTINGFAVTTIGNSAFYEMSSLTNVTMGTNLTSIGNGAFSYCQGLKGVVIGSSVINIGDVAFIECFSLTNVTIPNSVASIGDYAFQACVSLTYIIIGNGVTNIGYGAFSSCWDLANVTIPKSVTSIGSGAFADSARMSAISVDPANPDYSSVAGVLFDKSQTTLLECPGGKVGNYSIPSGITNIGESAFSGCSDLTNIVISSSVASIGDDAFGGCTSLTNVTIGSGVTSIGTGAFTACFGLISISVDPANPSFSSVAGVLFDKSQSTLILYPGGKVGSYSIPNGVTSIESEAFIFCTSLTGITISSSVTNIGSSAFDGCTGLTSVTISGSVTSIGSDAFENCTSLIAISVDPANPSFSSVAGVLFDKSQSTLILYPGGKVGSYSIPNGVTSIGSDAFVNCTSLSNVTISSSVTNIGSDAFDGCFGLTNVTFGSSVSSIASYAFGDCTKLARVFFQGNSPTPTNAVTVFSGDPAIVYYAAGTTGWGTMFDGLPTWNPQVPSGGSGLGVQNHQFGFNISGNNNLVVVVEACTNLANPVWLLVSTNTLTGGTNYFSDPHWTNYPARFYRFRSP